MLGLAGMILKTMEENPEISGSDAISRGIDEMVKNLYGVNISSNVERLQEMSTSLDERPTDYILELLRISKDVFNNIFKNPDIVNSKDFKEFIKYYNDIVK